jgi:RNA polymerase sigma-70 factor (sigma-E family)
VRDGDAEAFERFCRAEYGSVVRTAWLITGDREAAVDLAQEAFARAFERWASVSRLDRPGAWATRVVTNLALSWQRRRRREQRALASQAERWAVPVDPAPSDLDLLRALSRLTARQRTVIVLRYYADMPVAEVASALGRRPGTVRALTAQALAILRAWVSDLEVRDEPAR